MIDPTESLDEYLEAQNAPPEPFAITDDNLADWAAAKIIRKIAEIEANENWPRCGNSRLMTGWQ